MPDSVPLPTHMVYFMEDGNLKKSPRYGSGYADITLPDNYALFYTKQTGSIASPNTTAKVFIIKKDDRKIKEFYSSKYGNSPKNLRDVVESYIKEQLSNPQQTLTVSRKRKSIKPKPKRKTCSCKKK